MNGKYKKVLACVLDAACCVSVAAFVNCLQSGKKRLNRTNFGTRT